MKFFEAAASAIMWLAVGGILATIYWASKAPDQPNNQPCIPIYESGLECCQNSQG